MIRTGNSQKRNTNVNNHVRNTELTPAAREMEIKRLIRYDFALMILPKIKKTHSNNYWQEYEEPVAFRNLLEST